MHNELLHWGGNSSVGAEEQRFVNSGPQSRQNMEGVLVGQGIRPPSKHCRSTLEQGTKPTNAHMGPCDGLGTHPSIFGPSPRG